MTKNIDIEETKEDISEIKVAPDKPISEITLLLCSRAYLLGIFGSISSFHRLLGGSLRADEFEVGYDQKLLYFHTLQSMFFSYPL